MMRPNKLATSLFALLFCASSACAQGIQWRKSVRSAMAEAQQKKRLVMLHFWDHGCRPCVTLERNVFSKQSVVRSINAQYVPVKINASENRQLVRQLKVRGWPTDVILRPDGSEVFRMVSSQKPFEYRRKLEEIAAHANTNTGQFVQHGGAATVSPFKPTSQQSVTSNQQQRPANQLGSQRGSEFAVGGIRPRSPAVSRDAGRIGRDQSGLHPTNATAQAKPQEGLYTPQRKVENSYVRSQNSRLRQRLGDAKPAVRASTAPGYSQQLVAPTTGKPMARSAATNNTTAPQTMTNPYLKPPVNPTTGHTEAAAKTTPKNGNHPTSTMIEPARANRQQAAPVRRPSLQLPPNHPPLGLEGFCPVALAGVDGQKPTWKQGDTRFGIIHRNRLYLFCCANCLASFKANPDQYAPVLSGHDAVQFLDQGQMTAGQRKYGVRYRGLVFLFSTEASLTQFKANRAKYHARLMEVLRK